ncbi:MESK4 [Drosophila busckii]|uniref:MESK4 n=1 Tax=Drosophila busckii TaxID=30019 RepID=A0A0M4F6Y2_DROBS|nr:MESK4 [Drosophila busckii]
MISTMTNNCRLQEVLKSCAKIQSLESLPLENDYNDVYLATDKMISPNPYSISGYISNSSCTSEDAYTDIVLEQDNRISLAYENLNTIPRRLADKFAAQTKFLDLSYNNFKNLKFLSFFDELHTLILDRNSNLDVNTFPYLPSLKILWINNCDISNITDWIHRIKSECPALEQLSCMGNPGMQTVFQCSKSALEYILDVLPNLKYLDGVSRPGLTERNHYKDNERRTTSASTSSTTGLGNDSTSTSEKLSRQHRIVCPHSNPTHSFKDFFRIKTNKKQNQNSTVSRKLYANGNGSSTN